VSPRPTYSDDDDDDDDGVVSLRSERYKTSWNLISYWYGFSVYRL